MGDVILFGDARAAVIAALVDALGQRAEPYAAGAPVVGDYSGASPAVSVPTANVTGSAPHVQYVTVRVIAWHNTAAEVHDLAQLALALLLTSDTVACVRLTGPTVAPDPDDGRPMAAFTVRVAMPGHLA